MMKVWNCFHHSQHLPEGNTIVLLLLVEDLAVVCQHPFFIIFDLRQYVNSFLICGISNALDGSEDDHVSDDLPVIELDSGTMGEESGDEAKDSDSDADELGDPFSDDSDTELD